MNSLPPFHYTINYVIVGLLLFPPKTIDMITIKAEVLKGKQKSDGTYNVKIRMTYKREVKRLPTSIYVRKEDLTKAFKIKNPKFIKEANNIVRQYQELCASLPLETANYSLNDIIECIKVKNERKTTIDFIQFSKEWLKTTQLKGKPTTRHPLMLSSLILEKNT